MLPRSLEEVIPGLKQARAREQDNRALAFAGLTHTVCGVEIVALAPDHRLELQLVRNAFTLAGVEPLKGDVFQFLWVLSPKRAKNSANAGWIAEAYAKRRLRRLVVALDERNAARAIQTYLADQLQDAPEGDSEGRAIDMNAVHWMASEMAFWVSIHGGFTPESYRRTPYLVLQQLHRMWRINNPKIEYQRDGSGHIVEPQFINHSDSISTRWIKLRAAAVAAAIRARHERLP